MTAPYNRPPASTMKLFFFDSETGGLSPHEHDMVQVACVVTDPTGKHVLDEYVAKVLPEKDVHPQAAAINGYSKEKWAAENAVPQITAMHELMSRAEGSIFCAHNAPFDWSFFEPVMKRAGRKWRGDYHKVDTASLAWPLYQAGRVPNVKLATLAAHFNIDPGEAHTALADARTCRQIYRCLMAMFQLTPTQV